MKKLCFAIILLLSLFTSFTTFADDIMKIQQNGIVKRAKEFGSGNGIEFTLPALADSNFVIDSVELAVFEKKESETQYKIFGTTKIIENPCLKIAFDFGDITRFAEGSKYKIAYRYYARAIDDYSKLEIAGVDTKEGWRIVGEFVPTTATDNGFSFYLNSKPTIDINSISYNVENIKGQTTLKYTPNQLTDVWLPSNAFSNGIIVNYTANDADIEDTLAVRYKLTDAIAGTVIREGDLYPDGKIMCNTTAEYVELSLMVNDNWDTDVVVQSIFLKIDKEAPFVYRQFDDKGKCIRGRNLYSKFTIHDSSNEALSSGNVYYTIKCNGVYIYTNIRFNNNASGEYTVDLTSQPDGVYDIILTIFDKAYNKTEHTLTLRLDNTAPTINFLTPSENSTSTLYSTWLNQSKNIIIKATDQYAGVKQMNSYLDYSLQNTLYTNSTALDYTFNTAVTNSKTGKLYYYFYIYDNAVTLNKANNTVNTISNGNPTIVSRYVWLDKTAPSIVINADENTWYQSPITIAANFYDYESRVGTADNSGVMSKYYAIMDTPTTPTNWQGYSNGVTFDTGGVYYLYVKAVDYAGNETIEYKKIKINSPSTIIGKVTPTTDYMHTIYKSLNDIYVMKNTAYNTKFEFSVQDNDVTDTLGADIKLISEDENSVYAESTVEVSPNGNIIRNVVFNMTYLKADETPLPDGVYTMYLTISEIKNDGEILTLNTDVKGCEIVIKRINPPTPEIIVKDVAEGKEVTINYPNEALSNSLNRDYIKALYKKEYKIVKDKEIDSNIYRNYISAISPIKEDCIITTLYTDPAGNISTSTMRVYGANDNNGTGSIITAGNTVTVEETRPATICYIGTRRDKQGGVDGRVFEFLK